MELIHRLLRGAMADVTHDGVIPWSSPIPMFGAISEATVATVGINPSNLEFLDHEGNELTGAVRRFHTMTSLHVGSWEHATEDHAAAIADLCRRYFDRNPYNGWFRPLDRLIGGANATYYRSAGTACSACHIDLVPFATQLKWTQLTAKQRKGLLGVGVTTLHSLLRTNHLQVLVLNGATVVKRFEEVSGNTLCRTPMPEWDLVRKHSQGVRGMAYSGTIREFAGKKLNNPVMVLGYNHNIQSSYGVTRTVSDRMREWIRTQTTGVIQ